MKMKMLECAGKSYRMTRQRQVILDVLRCADSHPDAAQVYGEVRKIIPKISLGTVYRTLSLLREAGLVSEVKPRGSVSHYDARTGVHYHVTCTRCGHITDVTIDVGEDLEEEAASATGFVITGHSLDFYGLCPDCAQKHSRGGR